MLCSVPWNRVMYCRVNHIQFDASKKDEIIALLESKRETMMALPGIQSICTIVTGEGEITSLRSLRQPRELHRSSVASWPAHGRFCRLLHRPTGEQGRTRHLLAVKKRTWTCEVIAIGGRHWRLNSHASAIVNAPV